ncbi:hypothetical protein POM88_005364 [Heracleum sosnowskyi]|uniref:Uncharacterized protein n=1 Tax=Heracleum sosnowskyi TaxID=360622 RepID=A0AAD8JJZ7_9APIA|nr:hypothetical protein POM88_005364 [Heracleum sosnowskyi]
MHVSDGSETIQVFLLDHEVRHLISRSVDSFFGHDDKDLQYPTILKEIEGKPLTLIGSLNKENLLSGSTIYYASDVIEDIETSPNSSALEKTEQNYILNNRIKEILLKMLVWCLRGSSVVFYRFDPGDRVLTSSRVWLTVKSMLRVCWIGFLLHYWRVGLGLFVHKRTKNGCGLFGLRILWGFRDNWNSHIEG